MAISEIKEMRSLSIAQPWAHCIVSRGKNVENRSWNTTYRGTIAIHASGAVSKDRFSWCNKNYGIELDTKDLPYGAIVGFADLVAVITKKSVTTRTKKWFSGDYGFVLTNVIRLKKPVPAKGALNFWKLKGKPLRACLDQLTSKQVKQFKIFEKLT
jgi:activating signal cointegrator 1